MTVDDGLRITGGAAYLEEEGLGKDRRDHTKVPNKLLITKQYAIFQRPPRLQGSFLSVPWRYLQRISWLGTRYKVLANHVALLELRLRD